MGKVNWWDRNARKKESSACNAAREAAKKKRQNDRKVVSEVYRYFDNADHAASFAQGQVFVSTLKRCREYEDPLQGDPEEGFERYNTGGRVIGNGSDPVFVTLAARAGIHIGPDSVGVTIENNKRTSYLHDAYVICTTLGFSENDLSETFGKYCVKITHLEKFCSAVTKALMLKGELIQVSRGMIVYKERYYQGFDKSPGLIGFVKPPDKYAPQREYRFLWNIPGGAEISPVIIDCPEIVPYVTRVK